MSKPTTKPRAISKAKQAAGLKALLDFTLLKSTKSDPEGAVLAILTAARKAR